MMPPTQRGQISKIKPGVFRLRYYDKDGKRKSQQPFSSKSAAWDFYRKQIEPTLIGSVPIGTQAKGQTTFSEFVALYLERHKAHVRARTIATLKERLRHAEEDFGSLPLSALESMSDEISAWIAEQPAGSRYGRTGALRQCLGAAVRWEYIGRNPAVAAGRNRMPEPRKIRVFSYEELRAISERLSEDYKPLPFFVAATGLRPEEWQALEWKDIDRDIAVARVRRTVSSYEIVELGKTSRSRREVPLSPMALKALECLPVADNGLLFPSPEGKLMRLENFRRREWTPAIKAAGIALPARIYDLRSTFASNALAAGITVFELGKVMGTSGAMIERHYGSLLDGAGASIAARLASFENRRDRDG